MLKTTEKDFAKALDRKEIRCPACGKLLMKAVLPRGSKLFLRCRGTKCIYHKRDLTIQFL